MAEQAEFRHILRIANTDLDGNKPILSALRKIKGVSFMFANAVCSVTGIDRTKKTGNLSDEEAKKLDTAITSPLEHKIPLWMINRRNDYETGVDKHLTTGDIDYVKGSDIKRLKIIKAYRGMRHISGLPVRGQSTKSNFRRNKGKVAGVKKKTGKAGRA